MPVGPHLISDKSALECLSLDETNWLDNFSYTVITPLFFAETLADLEKEVGKGRTPEQVVGSLAIRLGRSHEGPLRGRAKIEDKHH